MRVAELNDYLEQDFSDNLLDDLDCELLNAPDLDSLELSELKYYAPQLYRQHIERIIPTT